MSAPAPTPVRTLVAVVAAGLLARLPVVMVSLSLVLVVRAAGHGFAVVGLVSGAYVLGTGAASPLLGRLADRRGPRAVLVVSGAASGAALCLLAAWPERLGVPGLVGVAGLAGAATPPVAAVLRALLPRIAAGDALRRVYGLEAALQEVLFVSGPLAVVVLVAVLSPAWALAVCGVAIAATTLWFAVPASRHGAPGRPRTGGSPVRSAGLRAVAATYALVGVTFGAVEIATIASLDDRGHRDLAGLVLASWAAGSLAGGLLVALARVRRPPGERLPVNLALLAVLAAPLAFASGSPVVLAALLTLQGAAIAPALGTIYELVPRVVPGTSLTEAFAWTTSAVFAGVALGNSAAGLVTAAAGPAAAFLLAVAGPAAGVATARAARREEAAVAAARATVG